MIIVRHTGNVEVPAKCFKQLKGRCHAQVDESTGACRLHKEEILFPTVPSVPLQRLSLVK